MLTIKTAALGLAASGLAVTAVPAQAHDFARPEAYRAAPMEQIVQHSRDDRGWGRGDRGRYARYDEPVYRDTRVWRGRDGNYHCRRKDGTTGLIVGAAAGALLGREIDRNGSRSTGTILGAAAGALLGKRVAQGSSCR